MKKDTIVLLSTYNGEKYLSEQMKSLFLQDYEKFDIAIRDDGSTDNTKEMLKKYTGVNVHVSYGHNIGFVKSFFKLLEENLNNYEYFAFCDQDDYWFVDKLSRGIAILGKYEKETPLLCFSAFEITDENLNKIGLSPQPEFISFRNALVENIIPGCSCVFNRSSATLALKYISLENVRFHDWWLYLVVSAFGKVIYDAHPAFKYRQHGNNVVGTKPNIMKSFLRRIKLKFSGNKTMEPLFRQALVFEKKYGKDLNPEYKNILSSFLKTKNNYFERMKWVFSFVRIRQNIDSEILLRIAILLWL